jgi:hypothetical protein
MGGAPVLPGLSVAGVQVREPSQPTFHVEEHLHGLSTISLVNPGSSTNAKLEPTAPAPATMRVGWVGPSREVPGFGFMGTP